ncbi:hypothetical protein [Macrococcoides canis]|uniref:Uncharacterized protein n=1 Tax=Macrococcoides canis TaxID=1855823 RepID=A0A4R6C1M6_9STAP|nr:hypothetical protein [Macrococcus]TDM15196.1 hypothetical protein ETI04_10845 [Macrococcus canis]TDM29295.1 hypothetical protein ETI03_10760 [Macrococcus canis]TDM32013.1 hypothetical protein ETI13_10825 [Macrococcus canis]TDM38924.1 hypothetical protein ETI10_12660 [Macrococcus goetzii]TDM39901.1 hypothetical protein ETI09_10440 [Macrococcus canis]
MSNLKIFKVKVSNLPKDKDINKVINLTSKKTYYFSEFNGKLKLLKEAAEKNNKVYTFDIEIVDYDAPNIVHFMLNNYEITKNTPDSIKSIIEYEALKDKNAEEKGVSEDYKKQFFGALQESEDYDVATNESVKNGKLKKVSIFSKLSPFKKKQAEKNIEFNEEDQDQLEELKADMIASAKSDELHKEDEIVNLSDSQLKQKDAEIIENAVNDDKLYETKDLEKESYDNKPTHLNASVNETENEINSDNTIEIYTSKPVDEEKSIESNINEIPDKFQDVFKNEVSDEKFNIDVPQLHIEKPDLQNMSEIEREEIIFLNKREEEKQKYLKNQSNALINSLKENYYNGLKDIQGKIEEYYKENKPDYKEYIDNLINEQAPLNKDIIDTLNKQLEEEDNLILQKDMDDFKKQHQTKKEMLKEKRELRLAEKRKELNDDNEKLKERGKKDLDNELNEKVDVFKEQQIKLLENEILKLKASLEKELNYNLIKYDSETFKNLSLLRVEIIQNKNKSDELKLQKEKNDNERKVLKLEEERINLDMKQAEAEISKANAIKDESIKSANDLEIAKQEALARKHELQLKQEENLLRKIAAEEDANRLKQQELELRQTEMELYKKEDEQMNKLIKSNYLTQIMPNKEKEEAFNVVEPASKQTDNKLGKLLTSALIVSLIGGTGYVVAENNGYFDRDKSNKNNQEKVIKDSDDKEYKMLVNNHDFIEAYKVKPNKKDELKDKALAEKDFIDAVELAKQTNDKEYLIRVYLANGNTEDLIKTYQTMSYEEKSEISQDDLERIAKLFIDKEDKESTRAILKDIKDEKIKKEIESQLQ